MTPPGSRRILRSVADLTREKIISDLQANLEAAVKKGNLAQANRALQLLQAELAESAGGDVETATDSQVMAELDALVFDDDILREHLRRRLAEFDQAREGVGSDPGGEAPALALLSPPRPSILFPGGHGL